MGTGLHYTKRNHVYAHRLLEINLEDVCFVGESGGFVTIWTRDLGQKILVIDKTDLSNVGVWEDSNTGILLCLNFFLFFYLLFEIGSVSVGSAQTLIFAEPENVSFN